jgi:hypothetical protein
VLLLRKQAGKLLVESWRALSYRDQIGRAQEDAPTGDDSPAGLDAIDFI